MESTVNVTEAQAQFPKLLREVKRRGAVTVQRRGKIAAFVISPERMEAMIETMEILANEKALAAIKDYESGKIDLKDVDCLE